MARDDAYRLVQSAADEAAATGTHLRAVLGDRVPEAVFSEAALLGEAGAAVDHLAGVTESWLRTRPEW
jgi:hypothetical protein